jgi:hypothetical protein
VRECFQWFLRSGKVAARIANCLAKCGIVWTVQAIHKAKREICEGELDFARIEMDEGD